MDASWVCKTTSALWKWAPNSTVLPPSTTRLPSRPAPRPVKWSADTFSPWRRIRWRSWCSSTSSRSGLTKTSSPHRAFRRRIWSGPSRHCPRGKYGFCWSSAVENSPVTNMLIDCSIKFYGYFSARYCLGILQRRMQLDSLSMTVFTRSCTGWKSIPVSNQTHDIDWLNDWMIAWLSDWLLDWLIDCSIDWSFHQLIAWLTACLIDWLIDWLNVLRDPSSL